MGNFIAHQFQLNVPGISARGFFLSLAYTAGKTISDSLNTPVNWNLEQNDIGFQDGLYNRRLSRAIDPLDVSQRAVVSLIYELPFGAGKAWDPDARWLRFLVGGWQLNAIGGDADRCAPVIVSGASNYQANRPNATGSGEAAPQPAIGQAVVQHRRLLQPAALHHGDGWAARSRSFATPPR